MKISHILIKLISFCLAFIILDFLISTILLNGIIKFYGFNNDPEILINGSSLSYYGFNRDYIEDNTRQNVSFYVRGGVGIEDRFYMIQHFLAEYSNDLKTVIYEVNPTLFRLEPTSIYVHKLFLPFFDNRYFKPYFKERMNLISYYIYKFIRTERYDERLIITSYRGYFKKFNNWQNNVIDQKRIEELKKNKGSVQVEINKEKVEIFKRTMELFKNKNIEVFLVMMPIYSVKKETYQSESYNDFCNFFKTYCSSNPNIFFIDFNLDKSLTERSDFFDPIHLNTKGQTELSKSMVEVLNSKYKSRNKY
jgi:hypothetical protein